MWTFIQSILPILIFIGIQHVTHSQQTGKVDLPNLGMSFVIPNGWVGEMTEEAFVMGSNTEPGVVLMTIHNYSTIDELKAEAKSGLQDANGTNLQLSGDLQLIAGNAVGGDFVGTIEWQKAKAFIAGVINPYGPGVTIMVAADVANYSHRYVQLGREIIKSLNFNKVEKLPIVDEWKSTLNDSKLTYMDSYSSTGGGYSSQSEIHLCAAGHFLESNNNSISVDTGGAYANSSGSGQGAGTWDVVSSTTQGAILRLNYNNGEVQEYTLTYEDSKTYLNGYRYFRTYASEGPDYAPNCY